MHINRTHKPERLRFWTAEPKVERLHNLLQRLAAEPMLIRLADHRVYQWLELIAAIPADFMLARFKAAHFCPIRGSHSSAIRAVLHDPQTHPTACRLPSAPTGAGGSSS